MKGKNAANPFLLSIIPLEFYNSGMKQFQNNVKEKSLKVIVERRKVHR
jgi:hypothetical protein